MGRPKLPIPEAHADFPRLPPEKDKRRKLSDQDIEKMRAMHGAGHRVGEIARAFSVTHATVQYHVDPVQRARMQEKNRKRRHPDTPEAREAYNARKRAQRAVNGRRMRDYLTLNQRTRRAKNV